MAKKLSGWDIFGIVIAVLIIIAIVLIVLYYKDPKFKKWVPKNLAKTNYIIDKNKINLIKNKNKIFL